MLLVVRKCFGKLLILPNTNSYGQCIQSIKAKCPNQFCQRLYWTLLQNERFKYRFGYGICIFVWYGMATKYFVMSHMRVTAYMYITIFRFWQWANCIYNPIICLFQCFIYRHWCFDMCNYFCFWNDGIFLCTLLCTQTYFSKNTIISLHLDQGF